MDKNRIKKCVINTCNFSNVYISSLFIIHDFFIQVPRLLESVFEFSMLEAHNYCFNV